MDTLASKRVLLGEYAVLILLSNCIVLFEKVRKPRSGS